VNERKLLNNSAVKGQLYTLAQALLKKGIVKVLKMPSSDADQSVRMEESFRSISLTQACRQKAVGRRQ
jgi:hypothetical protein